MVISIKDKERLYNIQKKIFEQIHDPCRNIHLLSQVDLDDDEIDLIMSSGNYLIGDALNGISIHDLCVCYYIMSMGMKYYDAGNFWHCIGVEINNQGVIGSYFIKTMKKNGLKTLSTKRINVDNFLLHSFIPNNYIDSFFNFIYRFYVLVLNSSYPEDIDQKLSIIANVFRDPDYAKNYSDLSKMVLITTTKNVLSDVSLFGPIVKKILMRLSNTFDDPEDVKLGAYEASFKTWFALLHTRKRSDSALNRPPYIEKDQRNKLSLVIPPRVFENTSSSLMEVKSSDGKILYSFRPPTSKQFDMIVSDRYEIPINWNPLDEFTVSIQNHKPFYINKNPGHILLSKDGESRSKVSLGYNMVIVPNDSNIDVDNSVISESDDYSIKAFMMNRGNVVNICGHQYSIEIEIGEQLSVKTMSMDVVCTDDDGNNYLVYNKHPTLSISQNNSLHSKINLSIGHSHYRIQFQSLSEIKSKSYCQYGDNELLLDLSDSEIAKCDGIHTVRFNNREVFRYLYIHDFSYKFKKPIYLVDEDSEIVFSNSLPPVQFNTKQGAVDIERTIDCRNMHIRIDIPSRRYSFDKRTWTLFNFKEIYFRDIFEDSIYIYCPGLVFPKITVNLENSKPIELEIDGPYLKCSIRKIAMLSYQLERLFKNKVDFYCGRFQLFTIRYLADYNLCGKLLSRINAPEFTYAKYCLKQSGIEATFTDTVTLPDVNDDLEVTEYYEDGLSGILSRPAMNTRYGVRIKLDEKEILSGRIKDEIIVIINGKHYEIEAECFYHIVSIDSPYDQSSVDYYKGYFVDAGEQSEHSIKVYETVCEKLKNIILSDSDTKRIKLRIMKFKDHDDEFAIELCKRFLEITDDPGITYIQKYLENKMTTFMI